MKDGQPQLDEAKAESGRYNVGIKELPSDERPRERLLKYGPEVLSAAELIAIVLRMGTPDQSAITLAQSLLTKCGGLHGLSRATITELKKTKGIGDVKAVQIAAFVELGKRLAMTAPEEKAALNTPYDAAQFFMPRLRGLKRETFKIALLDTRNRVIKEMMVSVGSLDSSIVKPREVFAEAVSAGARTVVVAHNHPSGDPTPSPQDITVTKRLIEAGNILGIELSDHIIIGDGRWVSLREAGNFWK